MSDQILNNYLRPDMIYKLRIPKSAWMAIHLALVLLISWVAAGLADSIMAGYIKDTTGSITPRAQFEPERPGGRYTPDYSEIIKSNIFNSSQAARDITTAPSAPGKEPTGSAPITSLDLRLIGTAFDSSGQLKIAVIEEKDSGRQQLYRLNEFVAGAKIIAVKRNSVILLHDGRREMLMVDFSHSGVDKNLKRASFAAGFPSGPITKLSESDYALSKRYVESQLKNMNRLITQVRAVPNIDKDGLTRGFKLFAIKKGSIFDRIGLRNKDIVNKINDVEINSAEKALELFQALRNETSFSVDMLRGSKKITLRFTVQ